jgi:hypothetical protein
MEGQIMICKQGEWTPTGSPCEGFMLARPTETPFKVITASEGKISEHLRGVSKANMKFEDCLPSTENDVFETKTGRIRIQGFAGPSPARYIATQLRAEDGSASYEHTSGFYDIRPGKYKHTVVGEIQIWGECKNKLWTVESEVYYDE